MLPNCVCVCVCRVGVEEAEEVEGVRVKKSSNAERSSDPVSGVRELATEGVKQGV